MWIPADVVLVARFPSNRRYFDEIVAWVVLRIFLQGNATCEFATRTLNPERAADFLTYFQLPLS